MSKMSVLLADAVRDMRVEYEAPDILMGVSLNGKKTCIHIFNQDKVDPGTDDWLFEELEYDSSNWDPGIYRVVITCDVERSFEGDYDMYLRYNEKEKFVGAGMEVPGIFEDFSKFIDKLEIGECDGSNDS